MIAANTDTLETGMRTDSIDRRTAVKLMAAAAAAALAPPGIAAASPGTMTTRKVPASGEEIPVIGMGSSNTFDVGTAAAERAPLGEVLRGLVAGGGDFSVDIVDQLAGVRAAAFVGIFCLRSLSVDGGIECGERFGARPTVFGGGLGGKFAELAAPGEFFFGLLGEIRPHPRPLSRR